MCVHPNIYIFLHFDRILQVHKLPIFHESLHLQFRLCLFLFFSIFSTTTRVISLLDYYNQNVRVLNDVNVNHV